MPRRSHLLPFQVPMWITAYATILGGCPEPVPGGIDAADSTDARASATDGSNDTRDPSVDGTGACEECPLPGVFEIARFPDDSPSSIAATSTLNPTLGRPSTYGMPASVVDDAGNVVVTWVQKDPTEANRYRVLFRRFDAEMRAVDDAPVQIDWCRDLENCLPGVLAMASGWIVLWAGGPGLDDAPVYVVLGPSGDPPAPRAVWAAPRFAARHLTAARLSDGFVVGWQDSVMPLRVQARRFDLRGRPISTEIEVAPVVDPEDGVLAIVGRGGDRWTAVWMESFAEPRSLYREFDGDAALGPAEVRSFSSPYSFVLSSVDDWLVVGATTFHDGGTVRVGALQDGVAYSDDAHWFVGGRGRGDASLSVVSLGGGEWFAIWIEQADGSHGFRIATSPGTPNPVGWDTLYLDGPVNVQSSSIGRGGPRTEDGWIVTYVVPRRTDVGDSLRVLRLTPGA